MQKVAQSSQTGGAASGQQPDRAELRRQRLMEIERAADAAGVGDEQFQQMCFQALTEFLSPDPNGKPPQPTREGAAAIDRLVHLILHPQRKTRRAALARAMLEQLDKSQRINDRVFLLRQLALVGQEESIARLTAVLASQDAILRQYALRALECNPAPQAAEAILAELKGASAILDQSKGASAILDESKGAAAPDWQVALINALGARREKTAVPVLVKHLDAKQAEVARAAAMALGNIGTAEAAGALEAAAGKASPQQSAVLVEARLLAAERLRTTGQTKAAEKLFAAVAREAGQRHLKIAALRGLVLCRPKESLPLLIEALRSDDQQIQAAAARLTLEVPGAEAGKKLLKALPRLPATAQGYLLEALAERQQR